MEELQRVVASSLTTLYPKVWRLVRGTESRTVASKTVCMVAADQRDTEGSGY